MSNYEYDGKHGLRLYSDINLTQLVFDTTDYHLIPSQRLYFGIPEMKKDSLEIPGRDGILDLSTIITKRPSYNNLTGSFTFLIGDYIENSSWIQTLNMLVSLLHGREFYMELTDYPNYSHYGRLTLSNWTSANDGSDINSINFDYDVEPYRTSKDYIQIYPILISENKYHFSKNPSSQEFESAFDQGLYNSYLEAKGHGDPGTEYPFVMTYSNPELKITNKILDAITIGVRDKVACKGVIFSNRYGNNEIIFNCDNYGITWLDYYYRRREL